MGLVRLHIQQHESNETLIENIEAKTWDDFVLIFQRGFDPIQLQRACEGYTNGHPEKHLIILSEGQELDFYGIEVPDESQGDDP